MANDFLQLVKSRRSIRKYQEREVERDKLLKCIEAARLAPSAENVQPWRFIVIDDRDKIAAFSKKAFNGIYFPMRFAAKAPIIIVMLAKLDILANRIGKQIQDIHYYFIDCGIAGEHLVLQAHELGLGTCWIGWFNARQVRNFLNIPKSYKIVSLISMGYPEIEKDDVAKRLSIDEILWFNKFGNE